MVISWGIVGAGNISSDFAKVLTLLANNEHQIRAVASRTLDRAQSFAGNFKIAKAYGDYNELANDKNIDIVYVGTINTQHFPTSMLMLKNGKHVLCEKPLTLNAKQTLKLINFAKEKKLFLMEGLWSRCFPAYDKLRSLIDSGEIGEVMLVTVAFGAKINNVERVAYKALGGGTILDLGVYTLQLLQFVYKGLTPLDITAKGTLNEDGVDQSSTAVITYRDGKTGIVSTHSKVYLTNEACIVGTKGIIKMPNFQCADTIITPTETFKYELPDSNVSWRFRQLKGLVYEIFEAERCIKNGLLESPKITHVNSLELAEWMDKMRADVGVVFNEDAQ